MRCAVFIQFFIVTCSSVGILCQTDAELDSKSNELARSLQFLRLEGRIVNGTKANLGQFPHQVSLRRATSNEHFCGGSIISDEWILSASHCMFKNGQLIWPWTVTVVAGQRLLRPDHPAAQRREVEAIIIHPDFDYWTLANDVALLKLKKPLRLNGTNVQAAKLRNDTVTPGTMCQVSGWGALEENGSTSNDLMFVSLPIISSLRCKHLLVNITLLPAGMLCAGYEEGLRDACQGDSGGPMMCGSFLSGIVSGGEGCARPKLPGLYSDIVYYRLWIKAQMNNYTATPDERDDWTKILSEILRANSSSNVSLNLSFYSLALGYVLLICVGLSPCYRV